jgi:ABC-type dipeptide/oligopeptide/nickel transport system permease component
MTSLTFNLLIGASIPLEALTGTSGIGHLAWQAALGRDSALIATVTLLVAGGTLLASSAAEIGAAMVEARRSA